jgi:tripartite-type tricarboxylate transporter receptor subunit TctC
LAPAKTPSAVVQLLNREIDKILKDPEMIEKIQAAGADLIGGSSAAFEARMKKDAIRLTEVIRQAGTKAD